MMARRLAWVFAGVMALMGATLAGAETPEPATSPRPLARPAHVVAAAAGLPLLRPRARPVAQVAPPAPVVLGALAAPVALPPGLAAGAAYPLPVDARLARAVALQPGLSSPPVLTVSTSNVRMTRPKARPDGLPVASVALVRPQGAAMLRPLPRPAHLVPAVPSAPAAAAVPVQAAVLAVPAGRSLRPQQRPRDLAARPDQAEAVVVKASAIKPGPSKSAVLPKKGSVCGDRGIRGEAMAPITAKVKGCGIADPVRITSVAGVRLSQPALMDCTTAQALNSWVQNGLQPNFARNPVVELKVAGHYVCRTRNHKKGAKVSEHGKGRAIDISGFTLSNGASLSILKGWRGDYGRAIKAAHRAACGTFGTTLGPGSDGYHEDHLHFDTARYRKGSYCK